MGKLVLVRMIDEKEFPCISSNMWDSDWEVSRGLVRSPRKYYKPIIVSETDEIKKYDWVYNPIYGVIYQWIKNADINFDEIRAKKILKRFNEFTEDELKQIAIDQNNLIEQKYEDALRETAISWVKENFNPDPEDYMNTRDGLDSNMQYQVEAFVEGAKWMQNNS